MTRNVQRRVYKTILLLILATSVSVDGFSSSIGQDHHRSFLIVGGTGRIGTAVASHILLRCPNSTITLAGRNTERGQNAVQEVLEEVTSSSSSSSEVFYTRLDWTSITSTQNDKKEEGFNNEQLRVLQTAIDQADCVIHTAGPYLDQQPTILKCAIASPKCRAYVDVSDPLEFLDASLDMKEEASKSGTSALLAAGAFPGMSNVLAMEAVNKLSPSLSVKDVRFNYFTAGLGGSGDVNLYITNLGFGEPMVQYDKGQLRSFEALSGRLLGKVNFYLDQEDLQQERQQQQQQGENNDHSSCFGNEVAKERIGQQSVFSWPFPEAATVARHVGARGDSSAAMGTAPDIWNEMLGVLVSVIPRPWWKSKAFSKFLADFSQPLVKVTDKLLRIQSADNVGETHAMRIDVTGSDDGNGEVQEAVSVVQAHESFRRCVGQSCAEFALDLLDNPQPGVFLPEQRYDDKNEGARRRIISRLTSTPGTMAFTGATRVRTAPPPTEIKGAIHKANAYETR